MAQPAGTNCTKTGYGVIRKMEDITLSDKEKYNIKRDFMTCFTIAKKIQRIADEKDVNPTFEDVETLMTPLIELDERREDARDDMCYFLQYEIDYGYDRRFHDKILNIRDAMDVAVAKVISCGNRFLRNIEEIDDIFATHQNECEAITSRILVENFNMTQKTYMTRLRTQISTNSSTT